MSSEALSTSRSIGAGDTLWRSSTVCLVAVAVRERRAQGTAISPWGGGGRGGRDCKKQQKFNQTFWRALIAIHFGEPLEETRKN